MLTLFTQARSPALRCATNLYQVKALCLVSLALLSLGLLSPQPARAQMIGSGSLVPCNPDSSALSYYSTDSQGFYPLNQGLEAGTRLPTGTYLLMQQYSTPPGTSTIGPQPLIYDGNGGVAICVDGGTHAEPCLPTVASNTIGGGWFIPASPYYTYTTSDGISHSVSINGTITGDVKGQLLSYFQCAPLSGSGSTAVFPASVNLLVRTHLSAATTLYNPTGAGGLSATASASLPYFGEHLGTGDPDLTAYHLVPFPVNAKTGLVTVDLGKGEVTLAVVNGVASTLFSGSVYSTTTASAKPTVSAAVKQDTRAVGISSGIEDSFYKGVYHNDNGSDGTDKYQHIRQLSNNSVDSVVGLINDPVTGQPHFIAGENYASNAVNFTLPTWTWTITGDGTPDSNTVYNLKPNGTNQFGLTTLPANLDFGPTWDPTVTKTTTFGVTVTDTSGVIPGVTATDTYTVTWHLPVEKWNLINSVATSNRIYPKLGSDPSGNTSIEPNRTIDYTIPTQEIDVAGPAVKTISVFLAGAGAAAPALMPEGVAAGPYGIATVSLLAAGSVVAGFLVPPDPGPDTGHTNYGDYIFAVQQQQLINNGAVGIQRFNPLLVDQALAQFNNLQNLYGASWQDHWNEDYYFSQQSGAKMRVKAQVGRYRELDTYAGDAYDQHGYTGRTMNTLTPDKDVFYVETWTYTP